MSGLDAKKVEEIAQPKYFTAEKAKDKAGEEAFFKQGEKAQVCLISASFLEPNSKITRQK